MYEIFTSVDSQTFGHVWFCGECDDLFHYFYQCGTTCEFWQSVSLWLTNNSDAALWPRQLEIIDFLFGFQERGETTHRINYILLHRKFYIYRQKRFHQGRLDTYAFLVELKHTLTIERMAALKENMYRKIFGVWEKFYNEL